MNTSSGLLHHTLADIVGWVLLHSLWQGALIGMAFVLVRFALRRHSADLRYLAGCLALGLLLAAPVATVLIGVMPSSHIRVSSSRLPGIYVAPRTAVPIEEADATAPSSWNFRWAADFCARLAPLLAATWVAGVALFSIRLTRSWWWVKVLRTRDNELVDPAWMETLNDLRCRLEISRPVRLLKSALVEVPTVIGWLRPVILLPAASLTGLTPTQLEAILAHELAHVRRLDYLVNAFQCLMETLMFYHPAVWWISRCVREEREHCCDDLVVKVCGDRLAYARALATLEECRGELPQFAFAASGGSLLNRIRRLLGAPEQAGPATIGQVAGFALLGIGLLTILLGIFLMLGPTTYSATARVKVDQDSTGMSGPNGVAYDPYFIQTEFELIQSEVILGRVARELNLNEEWGKRYGSGQPLKTIETIGLLRGRLDLRTIRNTSLIDIRVFSEKPDEVAKIANRIAEAFQEHRRRQQGITATEALESRLKQQEQEVQQSQTKVDRLREELRIPDTMANADGPTTQISAESLRRLDGLRIESKAQFAKDETLLQQLKGLNREDLIRVLPTASPDTILVSLLEQGNLVEQRLVALRKEYGPDNVDVLKAVAQLENLQAKINDRVIGIVMGLETKVAAEKQGLENLEKEVDKATAGDFENARQTRPYFDAKRHLEELQHFRQVLALKIESEKIDQNFPKMMQVEIVDAAYVPLRPVSPNRPRAAALIVLGALLDLVGLRMLKGKPHAAPIAQPA